MTTTIDPTAFDRAEGCKGCPIGVGHDGKFFDILETKRYFLKNSWEMPLGNGF